MVVELNHTIVAARDRRASAAFLTEVLGLAAREPFGPFMVVEVANGVSLDLADIDGDITAQHRAFLVSESEFDHIFGRVQARGLPYWADPARRHRGEINHNDGGPCRLYFLRRTGADPAGAPRACGCERPFRGRMSVTSSCLLTGRQKRFPKTTRRYDRSRHALTRHGTYAIAHYLAGGT